MKNIRIGFLGFWSHFDKDEFIGTVALRRNYDVEIIPNAKDADYVFYSVMDDEHWLLHPDRKQQLKLNRYVETLYHRSTSRWLL